MKRDEYFRQLLEASRLGNYSRFCQKGYFDFSTEEWGSLQVENQRKYAQEYQEWYAQKYNGGAKEKKIRINGTEIKMMLIPPGKFWMGSPSKEKGRYKDEVRHKVLISKAYWCGKYAVTQGQWIAVKENEPSHFKGNNLLPVEQVSWEECENFLVNVNGGKNKEEGGQWWFLSEAQWEYACRGGTTTPFNSGETISANNINFDGNYPYRESDGKGVYRGKTTKVGSLENANAWGLYDMHGNVWEWCEDWYGEYPKGEVVDPVNTKFSSFRVYRGGCWFDSAVGCRSAHRSGDVPSYRDNALGFRVSGSL
jgi:formylglycine-generating enzyme required for sulfatase activity